MYQDFVLALELFTVRPSYITASNLQVMGYELYMDGDLSEDAYQILLDKTNPHTQGQDTY